MSTPFPRLNCTHEEADDRMMFHVQDILGHRTGSTSLTLSSGDTDVFVCLLYHITSIGEVSKSSGLSATQE